jgi:hypothetical protein
MPTQETGSEPADQPAAAVCASPSQSNGPLLPMWAIWTSLTVRVVDSLLVGQPRIFSVIATDCTLCSRKNVTISAKTVSSTRTSPVSPNYRCISAGSDRGAGMMPTATFVARR